MKLSEYKLKSFDETEFHVYEWLPEDESSIKGIVQIAHGMAEHAFRYKDFAQFLTDNGFAVFANDHRGHGKTAGTVEKLGFLGDSNGWDNVIADMKLLSAHAREKFSQKPFFLLGHSMGSFLSRKYVLDAGFKMNGAIFSGTGGDPGFLGQFGVFLTKMMMLFYPKNSPTKLMDTLSFGAFNKPFRPNRTNYDWLSRDNEQVDKYDKDPFCGSIFSISFFNEMLKGILYVNKSENIAKTPLDLPILIYSGDKDPVGNNGKGVEEVYNNLKKAGIKDISMKLFTDGRHEMLNEINKEEVYNFVLAWILRH